MQLAPQNTAVIVVDMQNGFCKDEGSLVRIGFPIAMLKAAIGPCARVVAAARRADIPVIFTRYVYRADYADGGVLVHDLMPQLKEHRALIAGSWDAAIVDELTPQPQDFIIDKNRPSSFYGTMLETYLNGIGAKRLIVCGVTTNCCVETTVRDASQRDLQTFVVGDATGELDQARHEMALTSMGLLFARVVAVADVEAAFAPARGAAA
jgi:ureidoacrylate peracid hydrolase